MFSYVILLTCPDNIYRKYVFYWTLGFITVTVNISEVLSLNAKYDAMTLRIILINMSSSRAIFLSFSLYHNFD